MSSTAISARLTYLWETPRTLWGTLTTVDHKTLYTSIFYTINGVHAAHLILGILYPPLRGGAAAYGADGKAPS